MLNYKSMDIIDIYKNSQSHKIVSLDKSRGMLSHAYLIECADRFLLNHYCMLVAKEIFCLDTDTPCEKCIACQKVEHSNMVDLKIYPKEKNIVVDDVCEIVSDSIQRPMDSKYKVYILKDFDEATVQSQNKLLKTLEEPPQNVIFILTASSIGSVLQTIKSRVKTISEPLLDRDVATEFLNEQKVRNPRSVATISGGNIDVAFKFANSSDSENIINLVFETMIELRTSADILRFSSKILALKKDFTYFLDTFIMLLRDISVCNVPELVAFQDRKKDIEMLSKGLSKKAIELITERLCEIYNKLEFNCNLTGIVDQMLLDILEVKFLCQK